MSAIEDVAARVAAGGAVSEADAQVVFETADLISVGMIADEMRRRLHGTRTTFVRVFDVHVESPPSSMPPGLTAGEVRIVGAPASLAQAVSAVRATAALVPDGVPVTGFSLADLQMLASHEGGLAFVCTELRNAGMECVAELPIDLVDQPAAAVETVRGAGLRVLRVTLDTFRTDDRIAIAVRVRNLQSAVGGLFVFAPLPRSIVGSAPSTGYDDVKQVGVARLVAANIPSIQVDWVQYGPKLAQVALTMGADDIDGIAAFDAGMLGARRSPIEEIRGNIRAAGLDATERNGRFEPAP